MMEQYIAAAGWSEEEYIQFTNEGVASLILRQKLVDQEYGGDYDRLEAELDAECARLLGENAS